MTSLPLEVACLFEELRHLGVELAAGASGNLLYRPQHLLPKSLLARMREHKPAILDALQARTSSVLPQHVKTTTAKTPQRMADVSYGCVKGRTDDTGSPEHDVRMSFGKYKHQLIDNVPLRYLIWVWESGKICSDRLHHAIESRLWEVGYWNDYLREEYWPKGF